ncbi:uncharacterized protein LOC144203984 isoform X2 [Stigmatopora nigra]
MSGGFNFGQPSTGFSFGAAKTTATAAPTTGFGLTASTAVAPGSSGGGGFTFGSSPQTGTSSNPPGGFSFGTPAKSAPSGGSLAFGTPTTTTFSLGSTPQAAPAAGRRTVVSSGFGLGSGMTASTGFSFGSPAPVPAPTQPAAAAPVVAAPMAAAPVAAAPVAAAPVAAAPVAAAPMAAAPMAAQAPMTSAPGGLSFGGFSFGNKVQVAPTATTASATGGGFSFGANPTPSLTLGAQAMTTPAATAPQGGGFTLGIKPSSTPAPPAVTQAAPSLFSAPPTTTAAAPTSGFAFGVTPTPAAVPAAVPAATTTAAPGALSFTLKPLGPVTSSAAPAPTATPAGFSLGLKPASTTSIITTASTAVAAPITSAAPAVLTYAQLEGLINKWSLELEDQERHFLQQATQVNAWDRLLVENGEKITSLHKEMEKVKLDQKRLNQELDFILSQQKELEDLLSPLEESVKEQSGTIYMQNADEERERTYKLAENVDAQLKRMSQDLKEIIEHLNTSSGPADTSDPLQQICKILNAHMDSLQWIDQNSVLLQRRVEEVSKLCDNQRKEQEKTFRLTYD